MNPIRIIYSIIDEATDLIVRFWLILAQLLIIWSVIAIPVSFLIEGFNWFNHIWWLVSNLIWNPAIAMFNFFSTHAEMLRTGADWSSHNPIQDFVYILLFLGGIGLAFGSMLAFWFMWGYTFLMGYIYLLPMSVQANMAYAPNNSVEGMNTWHLLSGRTTIQDTFDAEVQANAIASALKKNK